MCCNYLASFNNKFNILFVICANSPPHVDMVNCTVTLYCLRTPFFSPSFIYQAKNFILFNIKHRMFRFSWVWFSMSQYMLNSIAKIFILPISLLSG